MLAFNPTQRLTLKMAESPSLEIIKGLILFLKSRNIPIVVIHMRKCEIPEAKLREVGICEQYNVKIVKDESVFDQIVPKTPSKDLTLYLSKHSQVVYVPKRTKRELDFSVFEKYEQPVYNHHK
jgi:hypothetical protein